MSNIYKGRGSDEDNKQLVEVLDNVFFRDEPDVRFMTLLPKLYKDKYRPAYNNFMIKEDGAIKASVGLFPMTLNVDGAILSVGGIGNVAVARDSRSKGYMIECMNMALDQMKSDGTDISVLGGQRQRYEHFGFEPAGVGLSVDVNKNTLKYIKGKDYVTSFKAEPITELTDELRDKIRALYERNGVYVERPDDDFEDILRSWNCTPYAIYDGGEFKGYFCRRAESTIQEINCVNKEDMLDICLAAMNAMGADKINFDLPLYDSELCEHMAVNSDGMSLEHSENASILNYGKVLQAYLSLKAKRIKLGEGSLTLLVHGVKRDENLTITVKDGSVKVEETENKPEIELEHLEAMRFFTGLSSKSREKLPAFAAGWFPVDFFLSSQDNV